MTQRRWRPAVALWLAGLALLRAVGGGAVCSCR